MRPSRDIVLVRDEYDRITVFVQSLEQVHQIRVGLGLPADPKNGDLTQVPRDLDQTFSSVRQALANLLQSAAPLSIIPASYDAPPRKIIEDFYKRDPEGNLDRIYAKLMEEAPIIKQAQSKLAQARPRQQYFRIAIIVSRGETAMEDDTMLHRGLQPNRRS